MAYAKLRKGLTFKTRDYEFKKDIWIRVNDKDVDYLKNNCQGRLEFAPGDIEPENKININNTDGIISMIGKGSSAMVGTAIKNIVNDELSIAESEEIEKIKNKYRKKREKILKEKEEIEEKKEIDKENKIKKKKEEKEKMDKIKDVTNSDYIRKKYKSKG